MNWDWEISDGFTSAQQNPQHTFAAIGNYDIKLLTTDEHGCQDSLTQLINIKLPPTSDFTYALNCLNSPTEFTNTSDQGSAPLVGYAWDFGDGQTSILEDATNTYALVGNYNVTLEVTNSDGCVDSYSENVQISPLPAPDFSITSTLCQYESTSFSDQTVAFIPISTYLWNFGDGQVSNQQNPTHTYNTDGDHIITLTVTDQIGCADFIEKTRYVTPDFSLNIDYFGLCTNTEAILTGEAFNPVLAPDSWE